MKKAGLNYSIGAVTLITMTLGLLPSTPSLWAQGHLAPLVVAVQEPMQDEFGALLEGTYFTPGNLVHILETDASGNIHPPLVDGTPDPRNPLISDGTTRVGTDGVYNHHPSGIFGHAIKRLGGDAMDGTRLFVRVYNADSVNEASFYGDSDSTFTINQNDEFLARVGATDQPIDARDSDGDGLNNSWEKSYGTDPNNSDTDGDGIPDDQDVLLPDPPDPLVMITPTDVIVDCNADVSVDAMGEPTVAGGCDDITLQSTDSLTSNPDNQALVVLRTWTATDSCGNTIQAVQRLTLLDTEAPTFLTQVDHSEVDCSGLERDKEGADLPPGEDTPARLPTEIPPIPRVDATDTCTADLRIDFSETRLGKCPGVLARSWVAVDDSGNESSLIQLILIRKDCVQPQPYWTANPDAWLTPFGPVETLQVGCQDDTLTAEEALQLLTEKPGRNESRELAKSLIVAILNTAQGANDTEVAPLIQEARDVLCRAPIGSQPDKELEKTIKFLRKSLDRFSNGKWNAEPCP